MLEKRRSLEGEGYKNEIRGLKKKLDQAENYLAGESDEDRPEKLTKE